MRSFDDPPLQTSKPDKRRNPDCDLYKSLHYHRSKMAASRSALKMASIDKKPAYNDGFLEDDDDRAGEELMHNPHLVDGDGDSDGGDGAPAGQAAGGGAAGKTRSKGGANKKGGGDDEGGDDDSATTAEEEEGGEEEGGAGGGLKGAEDVDGDLVDVAPYEDLDRPEGVPPSDLPKDTVCYEPPSLDEEEAEEREERAREAARARTTDAGAAKRKIDALSESGGGAGGGADGGGAGGGEGGSAGGRPRH